MYQRIKDFKHRLGSGEKTLYFAKVDVQAAFDTVPQAAILKLMRNMLSHPQYSILKHFEIQAGEGVANSVGGKPSRRWRSSAMAAGDPGGFQELAQQLAPNKKNTIFVDSVVQKSYDTHGLLALLSSHIEQNLVKIGKKYFRQKDGIPQGSVLSSILCNYFYADLEHEHLYFLHADSSDDSMLLRLIDDFLLVTTDCAKAARFVRIMHSGLPAYGVRVNPAKTLVSFELVVDGAPVPRIETGQWFPYCGTLLDTRTLDVAKDRGHSRDPVVFNGLTVEFARTPGANFRRKVLNAFRIQSHLMFFDTAHNAPQAVLRNIHGAFAETATKMWAYVRCLPRAKQPRSGLVVGACPTARAHRLLAVLTPGSDTIKELIDVAFRLLTSKSRTSRYLGYKCVVNKAQVTW